MIKIYCKYLKPIIAIILYFFITISSEAQFAQLREDIYMKDESSFSIGLLDLTTGKIKYKNEANKVKSVDSDQVLMVFNKVGEFIIFPTKEMNAHRADNFVKNATLPPSDLLITSDKKLIPAKIISKDETDIIYENLETPNGEEKISKNALAAIIYKSGNHELMISPSQASQVLGSQASAINNFRLGMPIHSQVVNAKVDVQVPIEQKNVPASSPDNSSSQKSGSMYVDGPIASENRPAVTLSDTRISSSNNSTSTAKKDSVATSLSTIELESFTKKALEKTQELSTYLAIISDRNSEFQDANKAIEQACHLFVSEESRVEISTNKGQDYKVRFKVREYMNRLKLLKYDKVEVSWSNINYVSNFRKAPDGNYYGLISFQQTFNGIMDGRIVYSDVTKKNVEVVLKSYSKDVEGNSKQHWDVLLSDIGIVVAKLN